jgi:hypothetical protein
MISMRPRIENEEKRLKLRNFRMADEDWEILEQHFKERRIPVGTGIRMVLIEYMKDEGLL